MSIKRTIRYAEDEEKQTVEITEKLDGKNGGYIWGKLLVDPISRKYFATKLYEDEKREKESTIAENCKGTWHCEYLQVVIGLCKRK